LHNDDEEKMEQAISSLKHRDIIVGATQRTGNQTFKPFSSMSIFSQEMSEDEQ
jgi:hypothetical protein